jgi:hypothetical protein
MSIRTETIHQEVARMDINDEVWSRPANGNVINDASYMGINFVSNGNNHIMIAGSMNPINAMSSEDSHHDIAEQGLAIRVVIPDCRVVARVLETDDMGASRMVRVDYHDKDDEIIMQILLRRIESPAENLTTVGISVNVIDDTSMYGNNVIYNENGMDNERLNLSEMDGKETIITGHRIPKQPHRVKSKKGGSNAALIVGIIGILLILGFFAIKNKK